MCPKSPLADPTTPTGFQEKGIKRKGKRRVKWTGQGREKGKGKGGIVFPPKSALDPPVQK